MSHGPAPFDDGPASVWLVDDSPLQAQIARRALSAHEVSLFSDANVMLERLASGERPDIIVLDWHMPGTSGKDACALVRERAHRAELPIIIVTASDRREDLEDGIAVGANDFVRKPFEAAELNARVGGLVNSKRLHERLARIEATLRDEATFREQFLAILAHDLRQPLNVFGMGSSILSDASTSQVIRDGVAAKMARASARMQRMIGELLDFSRSRPEHGMPIARRTTDLALVAQEVIDEIHLAHPGRQIDLVVVGACHGTWDADRLAQVVSNLVENALTNSPVDMAVSFALTAEDGRIQLVVENGGPTISPEVLPTIFDAFRREGATGKSKTRGLGLGLFIVAQIVRAHGGSITARSADGRTRFEISLPQTLPSAA